MLQTFLDIITVLLQFCTSNELVSYTQLCTICIVQTDVCNFLLLTSAVAQIHKI